MFGRRLLTPIVKTLATTVGEAMLTPAPPICGLLLTPAGAYTTPTAVTVAPPLSVTAPPFDEDRGHAGVEFGILSQRSGRRGQDRLVIRHEGLRGRWNRRRFQRRRQEHLPDAGPDLVHQIDIRATAREGGSIRRNRDRAAERAQGLRFAVRGKQMVQITTAVADRLDRREIKILNPHRFRPIRRAGAG